MVAKTVKVGPKNVLHVLFSRIINKFHAKKIQIGKSYNLLNSTKYKIILLIIGFKKHKNEAYRFRKRVFRRIQSPLDYAELASASMGHQDFFIIKITYKCK